MIKLNHKGVLGTMAKKITPALGRAVYSTGATQGVELLAVKRDVLGRVAVAADAAPFAAADGDAVTV